MQGIYGGMSFRTLFLGGGTPSLLGADNLTRLVDGLRRDFDLSQLDEATIEANPESATEAMLEAALSLGFDRISIGVQSLADAELKAVGRIHTARQAVDAIEFGKEGRFSEYLRRPYRRASRPDLGLAAEFDRNAGRYWASAISRCIAFRWSMGRRWRKTRRIICRRMICRPICLRRRGLSLKAKDLSITRYRTSPSAGVSVCIT